VTFNQMVEYHPQRLDRTLAAIADPTRRAILSRLALGDARVTDLAAPFEISLNAVSKHLRVLERAGLVRREVRGREHRLSLEARPLREAGEWIAAYEAFWEQRLDALEAFLRQRKKKTRWRKRG
jgi:DNA-binding transcriptional ArsR family regulator